jgi:hypothetical protein
MKPLFCKWRRQDDGWTTAQKMELSTRSWMRSRLPSVLLRLTSSQLWHPGKTEKLKCHGDGELWLPVFFLVLTPIFTADVFFFFFHLLLEPRHVRASLQFRSTWRTIRINYRAYKHLKQQPRTHHLFSKVLAKADPISVLVCLLGGSPRFESAYCKIQSLFETGLSKLDWNNSLSGRSHRGRQLRW